MCPGVFLSQGVFFASEPLLVCVLDMELVEYLDKSEALEVGDLRLVEEDVAEACALEAFPSGCDSL